MRVANLTLGLAIGLLAAAPASASAPAPQCAMAASLANPRLPLGRLRDMPAQVVCPPVFAAPAAPVQVETAMTTAPVTVIVLHELIVRPSEVIIEPPEVHFVDPPAAGAAPEPAATAAPTP